MRWVVLRRAAGRPGRGSPAMLKTTKSTDHDVLLVNAKRAAEMLSISPRTLWSLTNARQIPHIRIGRALRYSVADLDAWIDARKIQEHGS